MEASSYRQIRESLRELYGADPCPWLVGYSGGKAEPRGAARRRAAQRPAAGRAEQARVSANSTMVASLVFDAVLAVPADQRKKPIAILCADTRVEAESDETPRGQGGKPNPWGNGNRALLHQKILSTHCSRYDVFGGTTELWGRN